MYVANFIVQSETHTRRNIMLTGAQSILVAAI